MSDIAAALWPLFVALVTALTWLGYAILVALVLTAAWLGFEFVRAVWRWYGGRR